MITRTDKATKDAIRSAVLAEIAQRPEPFTEFELCANVAFRAGVVGRPGRFELTGRQPTIVAAVLRKLARGGVVRFGYGRGGHEQYRRAW